MIRYSQRKFDDAVAAYRAAIAIDANIPETHRNLGDSLVAPATLMARRKSIERPLLWRIGNSK